MSAVAPTSTLDPAALRRGRAPSRAVRFTLTAIVIAFLTLFILLPIANVFSQALSAGWHAYGRTFKAPDPTTVQVDPKLPIRQRIEARREVSHAYQQAQKTRYAIRMTIGVAAIAVPVNTLFGIAAAWAIAKHKFKGRSFLLTLIDLPFSFSPVVVGLMYVLIFGRTGLLGHWAQNVQWPYPLSIYWKGFAAGHGWPIGFHDWETGVLFTPLAAVIGSVFITFPFVARSLIPLMESQGTDAELAAITLGASGWQTFRRVTLPNIKWGLLYGIILCNARTMGEFGAVSVMVGDRDATNTIPLRVEKLWLEANLQSAFAVASLLTVLAVVTLIVKGILEWKTADER